MWEDDYSDIPEEWYTQEPDPRLVALRNAIAEFYAAEAAMSSVIKTYCWCMSVYYGRREEADAVWDMWLRTPTVATHNMLHHMPEELYGA